jgi:GTP-binding protein HflX
MNKIANKRIIFICVNINRDKEFEALVEEGTALVLSAGYEIAEVVKINRPNIDSKFFIGSGKVVEIKQLQTILNVNKIVVNHNLSSIQERNLELELGVTVFDRTNIILQIFASRVKGSEGILQVELALQSQLLSRLVKRWTHLERQRGGIGLRGGPGEKQIELDKRLIKDKIKSLKVRLMEAVKQRQTQRKARLKNEVFSISLVGYTNAGKSSLFNVLTKSNVYAEDRLFATLETTSRKLFIDTNNEVVISDTVGFIRDLPHTLIAAFRATLEETINANLLLHVVDVSQSLKERQIEDVNYVLTEIGAINIPQLIIYNKIDLKDDLQQRIDYADDGEPLSVYLSAEKNIGISLLHQAIVEKKLWLKQKKNEEKVAYEPWKQ